VVKSVSAAVIRGLVAVSENVPFEGHENVEKPSLPSTVFKRGSHTIGNDRLIVLDGRVTETTVATGGAALMKHRDHF
jgi:hypothetical protein